MDCSPFWELPGDESRSIINARQHRTPVDLSGIEIDEHDYEPEADPTRRTATL